jgi:hypothetical protein
VVLVVALLGVSAALLVVLLNKPGTSKPTAATASPSASPSQSQKLDKGVGQMGRVQTESDEQATVTVTVYAYRVLHSSNPPQRKGYEYGGADVRGCVIKSPTGVPVGLSWNPWSVAFADDTTANAADSWSPDDFQVALYPASDRVTKPGHCVRGWIIFEVPKGKKPARVVYAPVSASAPTEWAIP